MRWVALAMLASGALAGFTWLSSGKLIEPPLPVPRALASRYAGYDHARLLAETDAAIGGLKARLATPAGDMMDQEALSIAYVNRSRLTGNFDDLILARKAAEAGIAMSPPGTGPWLAKAAADYSAHKIADARAALDKVDAYVVPDAITRAEALAIRSDIAFSNGNYDDAARLLAKAGTIDTWPGLPYRMAVLARARGDFDAARAAFIRADATNPDPTPRFRADMQMRLGELDFAQGQWPEARSRFEKALKALPGYWRAEMKIAQIDALDGQTERALARFEAIAERWNEPDAMYVAAGLNRDLGREAKAQGWIKRASDVWTQRLAQLPEAAWGHALEHELAFGDPKRALSLAQKNAKNRPYGVPMLLLAEAWIANDQPDKALAICDAVERSGWVSADIWTIKAIAQGKLGRLEEARRSKAKAEAINPRENDPNPALAWFHD